MNLKTKIIDFFLEPKNEITRKRPIKIKAVFYVCIPIIVILLICACFYPEKKEAPPPTQTPAYHDEENAKSNLFEYLKTQPKSSGTVFDRPQHQNRNLNTSQIIKKDSDSPNYMDYIPIGSTMIANIQNKIVSNALGAPVIAIVTKDFNYNDDTVIPKDTKLIGTANHDEEGRKIHVNFKHMVLPTGAQYNINAIALDPLDDASEGISGNYHSNEWMKVTGALLTTFVGGVAEGLQDRNSQSGVKDNNMKNAALNGLSLSALDQAKRFTQKIESQKGYITVEKDYPIIVFINQELKIPENIWE